MAQFVLMLQGDRTKFDSLPLEEKKSQMGLYNQWVGSLVEKNIFKNGMGFQSGHFVVDADQEKTIRGPVVNSKEEVITGLFHIEAKDYDEATSIARTCPALEKGEKVIVYQLGGSGN